MPSLIRFISLILNTSIEHLPIDARTRPISSTEVEGSIPIKRSSLSAICYRLSLLILAIPSKRVEPMASSRIRQLRRLLKALHASADFLPPAGYYANLLDDFDRLTGHSSEIECEGISERRTFWARNLNDQSPVHFSLKPTTGVDVDVITGVFDPSFDSSFFLNSQE
ncbi:unnamed protein product [Lasius platythorax]|uniref:Uncharacterized protein n=1 Tax=Lasius platythorax TaxID=488582 RepID=A0AAV2NBU8_9HYME